MSVMSDLCRECRFNMNEALSLCDSLTENTHTHMHSVIDKMCVVMAEMDL